MSPLQSLGPFADRVAVGKEAAAISLRDFTLESVIAPEFSLAPVNLSVPTVRKHLKILYEKDFLVVYCVEKEDLAGQQEGRIYEINFKKFIPYDSKNAQTLILIAEIEGEISLQKQQNVGNSGRILVVGGVKNLNTSIYNIHIEISSLHSLQRLGKPNQLLSAVSDAPIDVDSLFVNPTIKRLGILKSISIPKKPRVPIIRSDSVTDVLANQNKKRVAIAATRVSEVTGGSLTAKSLQALLDKLMPQYYPTAPRLVVTAKAFGVLRKRIEAGKVISVVDLITFSLREWETLASQNRAAFLRNPSKAQKSSPLSSKPTFTELAYRLPYFIAAYSQTIGTSSATVKAKTDDQVSRLQSRLAQAEKANKTNAEIIRRISKRREPQSAPKELVVLRGRSASRRARVGEVSEANSIDDWVDKLKSWNPPAWGAGHDTSPKSPTRVVKRRNNRE